MAKKPPEPTPISPALVHPSPHPTPSSVSDHSEQIDEREQRLFRSLCINGNEYVTRRDIQSALLRIGLRLDDARLYDSITALQNYEEAAPIPYVEFCTIVRPNILLIERALQGNVVVPDFQDFCRDIENIFREVKDIREGDVARYIPQLARVNPEHFAVSVCTTDGQRHSFGDARVEFCVQSCSKPITYCMSLEQHGEDKVHKHVGREPSGVSFNELKLNKDGRPHNPMINAGAIMCCSLVKPEQEFADRFDFVMNTWQALAGGDKAGFSNAVYLSERATADRNFALGYFMRENGAFPANTDLIQALEFYFQCCSIELTADQMSVVAATLANAGVCPTTGKRVFSPKTVQNCLSLMYSCGMYDFSGEFAFTIGLPAKSGVSGALMVVVPNVAGFCIWSPRIDKHGNSVRGLAFCKRLVERFNFHNYDNLNGLSDKKDPRRRSQQAAIDGLTAITYAASKGDVTAVQQLVAIGVDLNGGDYDGRTPLHLAASEGHEKVVRYLIQRGANVNPRDRWGGTPLADALRQQHDRVGSILKAAGGTN
jgi:glutaminase